MATFNYKAIDKSGRNARGQMDAVNEVDLEIRLERMGLDLITFKSSEKSSRAFSSGRVSNRDLVMFCFQLEQLTSSGVPLLEGLTICAKAPVTRIFKRSLVGWWPTLRAVKCSRKRWLITPMCLVTYL